MIVTENWTRLLTWALRPTSNSAFFVSLLLQLAIVPFVVAEVLDDRLTSANAVNSSSDVDVGSDEIDADSSGLYRKRSLTQDELNRRRVEVVEADSGETQFGDPIEGEIARSSVNRPGMGGPGMGGPGMGGPGMGGPGIGGPGMGGPGYGVTWYPSVGLSGSNGSAEFGHLRQSLSAGMPLWGNGHDVVMLNASVKNTSVFTDAILPDSHQAFPDELWNVSLGTMYMHQFDNGWSGMLGINLGSASDQPFHSIDEINVGFMSMLQVPAKNQRDRWNFMLMYSPVGNLNFPIPGVAYQWNPSEDFSASLGLPFSITWKPTETLTVNASYVPILTVNARITLQLSDSVCLFGGFESLQETYQLADREHFDDRFMGFEQRLLAGTRWQLRQNFVLEFSGGYAFNRYWGTGQNQVAGDLYDRINIPAVGFISTSLQIKF